MDNEIVTFHLVERHETECFMAAFGGDPDPAPLPPHPDANTRSTLLWSRGSATHGLKWSLREYELRGQP